VERKVLALTRSGSIVRFEGDKGKEYQNCRGTNALAGDLRENGRKEKVECDIGATPCKGELKDLKKKEKKETDRREIDRKLESYLSYCEIRAQKSV